MDKESIDQIIYKISSRIQEFFFPDYLSLETSSNDSKGSEDSSTEDKSLF